MLLEVERVPICYPILAAVFSWLLLAGFLISPTTFMSISTNHLKIGSESIIWTMTGPTSWGLLAVACLGSCIAVVGLGCVWYKQRANYIWIGRYILL